MKYTELIIEIKEELLSQAVDLLACEGFTSLLIDDPSVAQEILDHPDVYKYDYLRHEIEEDAKRAGEVVTITIYFDEGEEGDAELKRACGVIDNLKQRHSEDSAAADEAVTYRMASTADDSEWLYKWQEFFKTTKIGERIVIKPSWEEYEAEYGELVIEMDPGMAFGSGQHETTTMCIKALEECINSGMKVLDVGTGTGVLAMAAALLGADECLGIDIDEEAVKVAKANIEKNRLAGNIEVMKGDLTEGVDLEADVIVANLMADLVIKLAPAAAEHLKSGGIFISSGILDTKCDEVAAAIRSAGFEIDEIKKDGEWRCIIAKKA